LNEPLSKQKKLSKKWSDGRKSLGSDSYDDYNRQHFDKVDKLKRLSFDELGINGEGCGCVNVCVL
jgi:hypothetical protein